MAARILRPLRCSFTFASLALLAMSAGASGCGRTDLSELLTGVGDQAEEREVEVARELTLADARIVYVELLAPAPGSAHDGLMTAHDGIELELLVSRLVPEGDAKLVWDNGGDLPVLRVMAADESVRALIWI